MIITIDDKAAALLAEMARESGVSSTEYLHALLHYATSRRRRPGSWEASRPFSFYTYDRRHPDGNYADRWF